MSSAAETESTAKPRRGVGFYIRVGIIPLLALVAVAHIAWAGTLQGEYRDPILGVTDSSYPIRGVTTAIRDILVEAAILAGVLRPWSFSGEWARPAAALVFCIPFTGYVYLTGALYAPPFYDALLLWVQIAFFLVLMLLVASIAISVRRARRA